MKKQKALMVKDFFSADGALPRGETIIIEHVNDDGYTRVQNDMGKLFVIPSHILKKIA